MRRIEAAPRQISLQAALPSQAVADLTCAVPVWTLKAASRPLGLRCWSGPAAFS